MGNVLSSEYTYDTAVLDLGVNGRLRGTLIDGRVRRFTGVPFAQPPVGEYRWRKTRPLPADHVYRKPISGDGEEPLDCSRFGATAWQNPMLLPIRNKEEPRYDEDCLTLNLWMPVGEPPEGGWPVMVWFHGGLLQMGNPCIDDISDPTELVSTAGLNCIVLAPAYRLSIFGFLASQELAEEAERDGDDGVCGNYGMWDQWTALMWLQTYGERLGGDLKNVTLAGMSAGAYSAHAQTAHALLMAKDSVGSNSRLIRRIALHSNAIPTNPKSLLDVQPQFDELLAVLGISPTLTAAEKLDALRKIDATTLMEKVKQMKAHTFRTVADGKFFPRDLMQRFGRGEFAKEFEKRGMSILIGEVLNEECTYRMSAPSESANLRREIANLYPEAVTDRLIHAYTVDGIHRAVALPDPNPHIGAVEKVYGDIVSDGQVRAPERLLVQQLREAGVPLDRVHRYLIGWKPGFVRKVLPDVMGVPHGSDGVIWNYNIMNGPEREEREIMTEWIQDLVKFVNGKEMHYGTSAWTEQKYLGPDGKISIQQDRKWEYLLRVANLMARGDHSRS